MSADTYLPYADASLTERDPLGAAIESMERARESHVQWATWLSAPCTTPACQDHERATFLGMQPEAERAWVTAYDLVLRYLRAMA